MVIKIYQLISTQKLHIITVTVSGSIIIRIIIKKDSTDSFHFGDGVICELGNGFEWFTGWAESDSNSLNSQAGWIILTDSLKKSQFMRVIYSWYDQVHLLNWGHIPISHIKDFPSKTHYFQHFCKCKLQMFQNLEMLDKQMFKCWTNRLLWGKSVAHTYNKNGLI